MAEVREYSLKLTTEQAQQNIDELNKSLQAQEDLLFDIDKELRDYEKQLSKTSATDLAKRQHLNDKIKQTKTRLKEEQSGLKDLNQERKLANREMDESIEGTAEYEGVLGMLDSKTGGAISGFTGMTKSISGATKGFNLMKVAIIGTGIGALLIALVALSQAFKSSEKGQNAWNKIMGVLGAVVDVFTDRLADLGELLIDLFTSPVETLKNFGKAIKEFVMDKVEKVVEGLGFMGEAISKLFSGDFAGAMDSGKKGLSSLNDGLNTAKMLTDAVTGATKGLIKEIAKEAKMAAKIADQRARADKLERAIVVGRAEADRDRAVLLEQAVNKEKFSLGERIAFLVEAARLEDEITKKEIEAAKIRLQVKIAENALGKSGKEALEEEAQLTAALIQIETARASKAKEVTSQIIGLRNEERANNKANSDAARTRGQARRDERIANEQAVQDFKKSLRIEDTKNVFAKIDEEKAARILELNDLVATKTEKEEILKEIEKSYANQKSTIEVAIEAEKAKALELIRKSLIDTDAERRQEQLNVIKLDYEDKIKLAEEFYGKETDKIKELREAQRLALAEQQVIFDEQDAAKKVLESEKAAEELALKSEEELLSFDAQRQLITDRENLLKEDKTISDADRLILEQSFADKKVAIANAEADAKAEIQNAVLDTVSNGINVLKGLAGKNKKVQKALLIAESAASIAKIAVNTGVANAKAVAAFPLTVGQPWVTLNTINAGLGIASAVAATSKGLSALGEGGSVPTPTLPTPSTSAPTPPAESVPPEFNTVGAGSTNQLADAIGGQSQQPIQTYVVTGEVSTSQELERNIVTGATIG